MAPNQAFVFLLHSNMAELSQLDRLEQSQARIEKKLDALIKALGEDEEQEPSTTLDGDTVGAPRDSSQSLG